MSTFPEHYQVGQLYQFERPVTKARIAHVGSVVKLVGNSYYYEMHESTFNRHVQVNGSRPAIYIKRCFIHENEIAYDVFLGTDKDGNAVEFVVWCSEVPFLLPC